MGREENMIITFLRILLNSACTHDGSKLYACECTVYMMHSQRLCLDDKEGFCHTRVVGELWSNFIFFGANKKK